MNSRKFMLGTAPPYDTEVTCRDLGQHDSYIILVVKNKGNLASAQLQKIIASHSCLQFRLWQSG